MPGFADGDLVVLSALGMYTVYEYPILIPNALSVVRHEYKLADIIRILADVVGTGNPIYVKDVITGINVNGYVYYDRETNVIGVYIPKLSYMVVAVPDEDEHLIVRKIAPAILYSILQNDNVSLIELIQRKALVTWHNGKLIKIPDIVEEPTRSGGVPIDKALKIARDIGKIARRMAMAIPTLTKVTSPVDVDDIAMDVTLRITRINFDIVEHRMFLLENPIVLSGRIRVRRGRVIADGDLRYHPNINYNTGLVCLGTMPPFDGTLKWIARLLNMLMIGRIDVCMDVYSLVFLKKFKNVLPDDIIRMYEKECAVSL